MTERQAGSGNIAHRIDARSKSLATALLCATLLAALPASAATSAPIKLATFDFELEDFSAGASSAGETPSDTDQLTRVTDEVRELLAASKRYRLVDVGSTDEAAAKVHTLRDCDGCDAAIALKLGAEQSFVGVVRRISRTEYIVRFQIRDARTGADVADGDSGLRMGANYSWSRGAARLIKDRLLGIQDKR
jgi:Protein of unknown function (DUF2380)